MTRAVLHCGDVRAVLASLPAESVQTVVTSPPYFNLRDYGMPGQIGLEPTVEEYVATMVEVFRALRRVMREDATAWLNISDSYAADSKWGGSSGGKNERSGAERFRRHTGLKPKDLCMIPARVALALQADGWWLRSDIIWAKPNPMPESVTDRPTRSHEYLFLLTKAERYYWDAQAIAEPGAEPERQRLDRIGGANGHTVRHSEGGMIGASATRNARSVWTIATAPYPEAHFATFPPELARRCILAGSSNRACEQCGAPWERVDGKGGDLATAQRETIGWRPTCSCDNHGTSSSIVLDPFGGSGTVAATATGLGRRSIYIDLNPKYLELARQRIGPMLCEDAA